MINLEINETSGEDSAAFCSIQPLLARRVGWFKRAEVMLNTHSALQKLLEQPGQFLYFILF